MAPMVRHEPGELAPADGVYALVGHYGEATNFSVFRRKGQQLPSIMGAADIGLLWYVKVSEAHEQARVA